jgi:hypothetical protein
MLLEQPDPDREELFSDPVDPDEAPVENLRMVAETSMLDLVLTKIKTLSGGQCGQGFFLELQHTCKK